MNIGNGAASSKSKGFNFVNVHKIMMNHMALIIILLFHFFSLQSNRDVCMYLSHVINEILVLSMDINDFNRILIFIC